MTDFRSLYFEDLMAADLAQDGAALAADDGLETAVVLSLFTDRRAEADDELPAGATDRRGWWGDAIPPVVDGAAVDGDRIGSRLWLLSREKQTAETLNRARGYAAEALAWLVADGIAERVDVAAEWVRTGVLGLAVTIARPAGEEVELRYATAWQAMEERANNAV